MIATKEAVCELKALVLEVAEVDEYEGNKYQSIIARVDGKLMKFKVDLKRIQFSKEDVDQELVLSCDVYGDSKVPAYLRVIGYREV